MLIFLIGMMGSGKTTLGERLAKALQVPFIDLDNLIESGEKRTIAQLFEQEGADKFRELERTALEEVAQKYTEAVVATGGGTPCFFDNMEYINSKGTSVFLNVPEEEIIRRLGTTDLMLRPLLAGKTSAELRQYVTTTLEQREYYYKKAHFELYGHGDKLQELLLMLNHK